MRKFNIWTNQLELLLLRGLGSACHALENSRAMDVPKGLENLDLAIFVEFLTNQHIHERAACSGLVSVVGDNANALKDMKDAILLDKSGSDIGLNEMRAASHLLSNSTMASFPTTSGCPPTGSRMITSSANMSRLVFLTAKRPLVIGSQSLRANSMCFSGVI
jgi:hypothetical protein